MEVETQILIGLDLGYLQTDVVSDFMKHTAETGRIINALMKALRQRLLADH